MASIIQLKIKYKWFKSCQIYFILVQNCFETTYRRSNLKKNDNGKFKIQHLYDNIVTFFSEK